jgi:hypothetical protein
MVETVDEPLEGLSTISEPDEEALTQQLPDEIPELAAFIKERFFEAEQGRRGDESRWLRAYNDFRGRYDAGVHFRENERSRVFVKIPKTKTLAAYGQLVEVIFAGNKFPIGIRPTEKPTGVAEKAHFDPNGKGEPEEELAPELQVGFPGDGHKSAKDSILGGLAAIFPAGKFSPGRSLDPKKPQVNPADEAAREMETHIHDQLTETHAAREMRSALFQSALYGTGIVKGPFNYKKTIHRWEIETPEDLEEADTKRVYTPEFKVVPRMEHVSVWNLYPDPNADCIEDCEFVIERHRLNRSQFRNLAKRPFFKREALGECLEKGPNYVDRGYESNLDDAQHTSRNMNRWEVLEYWGVVDKTLALEMGVELDEDMDQLDEVQINAWICENTIIRAVLNPFEPQRIPYQVFPYEVNPHSFFGIGVPENMSDSTIVMNGHARMAIDNLALSGNLIFDIDESALVPGQDNTMFPGKQIRRQSGLPGQAVYPINFPNVTNENMQMFDKWRQLADEQTGIPSYSHGQTGVQSTTRTAAGMSMLMGAASLNIKTIVKNLDDFLLKPLGESYFHWNRQFNNSVEIKGDLEVKALGTEAVMQKEVRSQRITQFLQASANPYMAPFVKFHTLIKELAITLDLDPEDITNNPEEAMIAAQIFGATGAMGEGQGEPGADQGPTGTGGGTIGVGGAPQPGDPTFSGTPGGNGGEPQP